MAENVTVHAAVAVLRRPDGQVLLGQRPEGKPWAGWWEFPGGKIEAGESPLHALQRELHEELGIEAIAATPWLTRTFSYPERTVKLHFFIVEQWQGEPHGRENQQLSWQRPEHPSVSPLLPANEPVMQALRLPPVYAITHLAELGEARFFESLERALEDGLKLIQVREKSLDTTELQRLTDKVLATCAPYGAQVLLNGDAETARAIGAHGIHLPAAQLMGMAQRPGSMLCAASCHNAAELRQAATLGLDFVLLSPVKNTLSHPDTPPLGWDAFARLVEDYPLPVYALGGMHRRDLADARQHGAHGIAMQRAAWER